MVVTLAATVGIPLQVPNRGLLPPIIVLAVMIPVQRAVSLWGMRQPKVEVLTAGETSLLVRDGRLIVKNLLDTVLSREKVFAVLRENEIQQLGQVHRLYIEPSGTFTLFPAVSPTPGLSLIPEIDPELRKSQRPWRLCM